MTVNARQEGCLILSNSNSEQFTAKQGEDAVIHLDVIVQRGMRNSEQFTAKQGEDAVIHLDVIVQRGMREILSNSPRSREKMP